MSTPSGCSTQANHFLDAFFHTNRDLDTNTTAATDKYSATNCDTTTVSHPAADIYTYDYLDAVHYTFTDDDTTAYRNIVTDQYSAASNCYKYFGAEHNSCSIKYFHSSTNELAYTDSNSYLDTCLSIR